MTEIGGEGMTGLIYIIVLTPHTQHSINNDHIRKMKNLNNLMKLPLLIAIHDKEKSPKDKSRSDDYMFATDTC